MRPRNKAAGEVLTAKQAPRRPGTAPALGLRAGGVVVSPCVAGSPTNATIAHGQGQSTILDDGPRISISDVSKKEGNGNKAMQYIFTVTLLAAYDEPVTVNYATGDSGATAGSDYVAALGTLTFAPGQTTKTFTVAIKGDKRRESDESFWVTLSGASSNAQVDGYYGFGTILNDDNGNGKGR